MSRETQPVNSDGDEDKIVAALAARIRQAMGSKGMTAAAFAESLGVSERTVQRYMSGETEHVPALVVLALARKTGYALGWLLTGEGPMKATTPDAEQLAYREIADIVERTSRLSEVGLVGEVAADETRDTKPDEGPPDEPEP